MKALRLLQKESLPELVEIEKPEPGDGEILIRIQAAALNHRDLYITKGLYPGVVTPCTFGSDGAGTVEAVGAGVSEEWMGREVIVNPGIAWGDDERHQSKDFRVLGIPDEGTFAEYFTIPAEYVHPKPAHLSMEEAAALPIAGLTAYRSLFSRGGLQNGEKVLITGIGGGVAQVALKLALSTASEVYVTSGSEAKLEKAKSLGAAGGVLYKKEEWWKELKEQAGTFDLIIDSAGGEDFKGLIQLSSMGARIVFYGATQGTIPDLLPQPIFWKQLSLLGSTMGSDKDFRGMLEQVNAHRIHPELDRSFLLEQGKEAFAHLEKQEQFGKVILKVGE